MNGMKVMVCVFAMLCMAMGVFAQTGEISAMSGEVELKHAGAAVFVPAQPGDAVAQDTTVSTGFKSTALITIGSSVIAVRPLTRLSLAEISSAAGSETLNVSLQTGRVKVDVTPPAGTKANFTVQSPSATASVRGTSFEFDTRNLSVLKGMVAFMGNRGMTMMVPAGAVSHIGKEDKAIDPLEQSVAALLPSAPAGAGEVEVITPAADDGSFDLIIVY